MPQKPDRVLDVWIVETQAVYTDVPFTVVTDWVQQGRLLPDDRVRLAGNKNWHPIQKVSALRPYLPQEEPLETTAASEAMEPVDLGWNWKRPEDSDDEDVDMIPLIDISLVLLIFFMMTATVSSGILAPIQTPQTRFPGEALVADQYWIGIDAKGKPDAMPTYSLGRDKEQVVEPTTNWNDFRTEMTRTFAQSTGEIKVRIRADRVLPIEEVTKIIRELRELQGRLNRDRAGSVTFTVMGEVSEGK